MRPAVLRLLVCAPAVTALAAATLIGPASSPVAASTPAQTALCNQVVAPGQATCYAVAVTGYTPMTAGAPAGYGPADLQSAYALPAAPAGAGQTVYIVDAYDDPTAESDLATYRAQYGLPPCTTANGCFAKLNQNGAASPLPAYNSGWAGEIGLDVEMVSAVCPSCTIRLIESNDSGSSLYLAVQRAVSLGARFVSMSWGGPEFSSETSMDATYFATPGVLFAAATGDNGFGGGPSYPAMSPNVLAVGGTSLRTAATARGWSETAWGGAGSGCSAYEPKPSWQAFIGSGTCSRRAGSDVSAVADPGTGLAVFQAGAWHVFGGTSAAAPIVASMYALAGTPAADSQPQAFPYSDTADLGDVTGGSTGTCTAALLCTAAAGWDGPTGLGTPYGVGALTGTGTTSTPPAPTELGATLTADTSVVPGLPAHASVTVALPTGRTLSRIAWTSGRADCGFAAPAAADTTVTCSAAATGSTTITATVTDSSGATKKVSGTLTFLTAGAKRDLAVQFSVDNQDAATRAGAGVCTGASVPAVAAVVDVATGAPVKGLTVTYTRQAAGALTPTTVASLITGAAGSTTSNQTVSAAATYAVHTTALGPYNASATVGLPVTVGQCTPTLAAAASTDTVWYGDPVTVTGTVTRPDPSGTGTLPVPNLRVPVTVTTPSTTSSTGATIAGTTTTLGTATTGADGAFSIVVKPLVSGALAASVPGTTGFVATKAALGPVTVQVPTTTITGSVGATEIGYGTKVTVTGTLTSTAATTTPLAGASVTVSLLPDGRTTAVSLGTGKVATDGTFSAAVAPTASGTLSVRYAGAAGHPAATATAGAITVDAWTPSLTLTASTGSAVAGTAVTYSGSVTRSCPVASGPAPSLSVKIVLTPSSGTTPVTLGTTVTTTTGTFRLTGYPRVSGTVTAVVTGVAGYLNASSPPVAFTAQ